MFCVECGKEGPIFKDGVCKECYLKTHSFTKGPESFDIPVCTHCNSFKYKNTWTSELFGDVLKRKVKSTFNISKELQKIDINTECKEEKERLNCKVYISGFIDDVEICEEHKVFIYLKKTVCEICSKKFGGYHEAILQIRSDKRNLTEKEINEIISNIEIQVENLKSKGNRSLFITDLHQEHGGIDFYLSDKGAALTIINKIHDSYGGEIKKSSKNIGMKDSKQVYRVTYLLRIPGIRKGDIISFKDSYFFVSSISKNKIHTIELSTWKKRIMDYKQIKNAHVIGGEELTKEMILVNQTDKEAQVMDEKTYKITIIKKPKKIILSSEKIKIITIENQSYLLPVLHMLHK